MLNNCSNQGIMSKEHFKVEDAQTHLKIGRGWGGGNKNKSNALNTVPYLL